MRPVDTRERSATIQLTEQQRQVKKSICEELHFNPICRSVGPLLCWRCRMCAHRSRGLPVCRSKRAPVCCTCPVNIYLSGRTHLRRSNTAHRSNKHTHTTNSQRDFLFRPNPGQRKECMSGDFNAVSSHTRSGELVNALMSSEVIRAQSTRVRRCSL